MRKKLVLVALGCGFAVSCYPASEPTEQVDGFQGFKWGTLKTEIIAALKGEPGWSDRDNGKSLDNTSAEKMKSTKSIPGYEVAWVSYVFSGACSELEDDTVSEPCSLTSGMERLATRDESAFERLTKILTDKNGSFDETKEVDRGSSPLNGPELTRVWRLPSGSEIRLAKMAPYKRPVSFFLMYRSNEEAKQQEQYRAEHPNRQLSVDEEAFWDTVDRIELARADVKAGLDRANSRCSEAVLSQILGPAECATEAKENEKALGQLRALRDEALSLPAADEEFRGLWLRAIDCQLEMTRVNRDIADAYARTHPGSVLALMQSRVYCHAAENAANRGRRGAIRAQ